MINHFGGTNNEGTSARSIDRDEFATRRTREDKPAGTSSPSDALFCFIHYVGGHVLTRDHMARRGKAGQ